MRLTKHHGLGNDFLVLIDLDALHPIDDDIARAVCDRRRGVGADGLIRVTRGDDQPFRMELRNEDGSRAEMSGNGISCLAQAVVRAGHATGTVEVGTDAGPRSVTVVENAAGHLHRMRVAMGAPVMGDELVEWTDDDRILRAVHVDVGNPHVVCHVPDPDDAPDLAELGRSIDAATPGGTNVELVTPEDGGLRMSVYERGVGITQACGTGAVAVAAAGNAWGLSPSSATVRQPGGDALVELGSPAHLTVPVVAVASVEWPL